MRRMVLIAGLATALAGAAVDVALGCSCAAPENHREDMANADGAVWGKIVGRSVADQTATYRIQVIEAYKGDLGSEVELETSASGASCGLESEVGDTVGLLLRRQDGAWTSSLCSQRTRAQLEEGAKDLPPPSSRAPVRVVAAGEFGAPPVAGLDASGRLVGYGDGDGDVTALSACPGGSTVLGLVSGLEGRVGVSARDPQTLRETGVRLLSLRGADQREQVIEDATALRCLNGDGGRAVVFVYDYDSRARLVLLDGGEQRTIWRGTGNRVALGAGRAYVNQRGITRIDLASGRSRRLGHLGRVFPLTLSPDGRRLVVGRGSGEETAARLRVLSTRTGRVLGRHRQRSTFQATWIGNRGVLVFSDAKPHTFLTDAALRLIGPVGRTQWGPLAVTGDRAMVVSGGRLLTVHPDGRIERSAGKVPEGIRAIAVLPGATSAAASRRRAASRPCSA